MNKVILLAKGLHPGLFLDRELRKRKIAKGRFALLINEYPQTITTITKGKRNMNPGLALKIEKELGLDEGDLMVLQAYYEVEREKKKQPASHPDLTKIRRVLFWDTSFEKINWQKHKNGIIRRVFERGNEEEKTEITRFYGAEIIKAALKKHG